MAALEWRRLTEVPNLVAPTVWARLRERLRPGELAEVQVASIDPALAAGEALCDHYGIDYGKAANCVVVTAVRGPTVTHAACGIPPGSRSDLNGTVRRHLGARRVSLMDKGELLTASRMEHGSVSLVGLPNGWRILLDDQLCGVEGLVMGSGLLRSKMWLPTHLFKAAAEPECVTALSSLSTS